MRVVIGLVVVALVIGLVPAGTGEAATQFSVWPAEFSYGVPGGSFTWTSTMFGLRFGQPLGPFVGLDTTLRYGAVANLDFPGASLSSYSGSTLVADSVLRVGLRAGTFSVAGFGGYGGLFMDATSASNSIVLQSLGTRLGVEASLAVSHGLVLRGNYTIIPSLTARADIANSSPPPAPNQYTGSGTGSEYEIALVYSPLPVTTVYAGYRGGTQSISWSGFGTTSTTFNGFVAGIELHF